MRSVPEHHSQEERKMTRKAPGRQSGSIATQDTTFARAAIALIAIGMIAGALISL